MKLLLFKDSLDFQQTLDMNGFDLKYSRKYFTDHISLCGGYLFYLWRGDRRPQVKKVIPTPKYAIASIISGMNSAFPNHYV